MFSPLLNLLLFCQLIDPGATGYTFVKLGIGVRPVALANAFTALSDDANAVFWNPSGLGIVNSYYVSGMAMKHLVYFNYYNLTSAVPIGRYGGLGFGLSYLGSDDIEYSERGEPGETFKNSDMLMNIGYGKSLNRHRRKLISFGAALKVVRSQLYTYSAYGVLSDLGVILRPYKYLYLGTVLKNLGSPRRFIEKWEYPPVNFRQGVAFKLPFGESHFALSFDYSIYPDVKPTFSFGSELRIRSQYLMELMDQANEQKSLLKFVGFALMAGYQSGYESGPWSGFSFGFSLELTPGAGIYLDIAALVLSYGYLGTSERIALGLNYVPVKKKARK